MGTVCKNLLNKRSLSKAMISPDNTQVQHVWKHLVEGGIQE